MKGSGAILRDTSRKNDLVEHGRFCHDFAKGDREFVKNEVS